jgi:hypothetical protein
MVITGYQNFVARRHRDKALSNDILEPREQKKESFVALRLSLLRVIDIQHPFTTR